MTIFDKIQTQSAEGPSGLYEIKDSNGTHPTPSVWAHGEYLKKSTYGQTTERYAEIKSAGGLLPHTHFQQTEVKEWIDKAGSARSEFTGTNPLQWREVISGYGGGTPIPSQYHQVDTAFAGAELQRAAANIYTNGFDALTFLSESSKMASQFRNFSKRIRRLASNRGRLRSAKELHRLWTEGRYGWRILAFDAKNLHDAVLNFDESRKLWTERSGYTYHESDTFLTSGTHQWPSLDLNTTQTYATEHSVRGSVSALVELSRFIANPILTAWELIPLSFVLDWVLTVGNAISTASLLTIANSTTASIGTRSTCKYNLQTDITSNSTSWHLVSSTPAIGSWEVVSEERTPSSLTVQPQLSGRILKPEQILDLTSIARVRANL